MRFAAVAGRAVLVFAAVLAAAVVLATDFFLAALADVDFAALALEGAFCVLVCGGAAHAPMARAANKATGTGDTIACKKPVYTTGAKAEQPDPRILFRTMHRRDLLKLGAFAIPSAWAQQASKADWKPSFLDDHQNETVIALTDLIIPATDTPGAKAAQVNRYIDLFLRDGDPSQRQHFLAGLNFLDGRAIETHGHPFIHLTAAQQTEVLHSIEGHEFFRLAKSMTANIYYNTQIGYQELNKGGRVPATFGCTHGSHA